MGWAGLFGWMGVVLTLGLCWGGFGWVGKGLYGMGRGSDGGMGLGLGREEGSGMTLLSHLQ